MSYTHNDLVNLANKWLKRRKKCGVTMVEWYGGPGEIPDAIGFRYTTSILIEVKVSYNDFKKDFDKHFRKRMGYGMGEFRYYMCPKGIIPIDEVPKNWGLLEVKNDRIYITKEANKIKRGVMTLRKENQLMVNALRAVICSTGKELDEFRLCNDPEYQKQMAEKKRLKAERKAKRKENKRKLIEGSNGGV